MRPRAADDTDHIYAILQQRKREREAQANETPVQPPCDTEPKPLEDFASGWSEYRVVVTNVVPIADGLTMTQCLVIPGEQTDGPSC